MEERPGWALALSGQTAGTMIKKALAAYSLKPAHGHVLTLLAENGAMSQQAILEVIGTDPSVLVAILNDLESEGLAERRRNPADRRRHIVEITSGGTDFVAAMDRAVAEVEAELFADLTADEITVLYGLLARVRVPGSACAGEH